MAEAVAELHKLHNFFAGLMQIVRKQLKILFALLINLMHLLHRAEQSYKKNYKLHNFWMQGQDEIDGADSGQQDKVELTMASSGKVEVTWPAGQGGADSGQQDKVKLTVASRTRSS